MLGWAPPLELGWEQYPPPQHIPLPLCDHGVGRSLSPTLSPLVTGPKLGDPPRWEIRISQPRSCNCGAWTGTFLLPEQGDIVLTRASVEEPALAAGSSQGPETVSQPQWETARV